MRRLNQGLCVLTWCACFVLTWGQQCNISETQIPEVVLKEPAFLNGWIQLSNNFVNTVSSKGLPFDLITTILEKIRRGDSWSIGGDEELLKNVFREEAGFATCLIMGLLFVVVMFFGWMIFLCCRACGNCGGNKMQRQTKTINSRRRIYIVFTIGVLGFLIVAVTSAFMANWEIKQLMLHGDKSILETVDDLEGFFDDSYSQILDFQNGCIDQMIEAIKPEMEIFSDESTRKLADKAKEVVHTYSGSVKAEIKKADTVIRQLEIILENIEKIKKQEAGVENLKTKIQDLNNKCGKCIKKESDFQDIPENSFKDFDVSQPLKELQKINFTNDADKELDKITELVVIRTRETRKYTKADVEQFIQDKDKYIDSFKENFVSKELDPLMKNVHKEAKSIRNELNRIYSSTMPDYEPAVYWGIFGVVMLVTLPTIMLLLGLLGGMCGHNDGRYPSERSCLSNCGGCTLMASVYMMFIFSAIAMLVTVALFQAGGHIQAFGCRFLYDDLAQVDKVYNIAMNNSKQSPVFKDVNISDIVRKCEDNTAIVDVLPFLQEKVAIATNKSQADIYINKTAVIVDNNVDELHRKLEKSLKIMTNSNNQVFDPKILQDIFTKSGQTIIKDIKGAKEQINNVIVKEEAGKKLLNEVKVELEDLENAINIRKSIKSMEGNLGDFNDKMSTIYENMLIQLNKTEPILKDRIMRATMEHYKPLLDAIDIGSVAMKDIGKCGRIYAAFKRGRHFVCKEVLGPVNALWFSLGACCFFFLFAIPFATKLSKHYYRMANDEKDTYLQIRMPPSPKQDYIPRNQTGYGHREPPRFYTDDEPRLNAYKESPVRLTRGPEKYEREDPRYYPQNQRNYGHHQNQAYEPDIDSRWKRY